MINNNYYSQGDFLRGGYHIAFTWSHELPIKLHGFRQTTGQPALVKKDTVNTIIGHAQIDPQFRPLKHSFIMYGMTGEDKNIYGAFPSFQFNHSSLPVYMQVFPRYNGNLRKELETSILGTERLLSKENGVCETGTFHSFLIVFVHFCSFLEIVVMSRQVNASAVPMAAKPMPQQKVNLHKRIYNIAHLNIDKLNANFFRE